LLSHLKLGQAIDHCYTTNAHGSHGQWITKYLEWMMGDVLKVIVYPFENGKKYNLFQFFWFAQKFPVVVLIGTEILLASGTTMNLLPFCHILGLVIY